MNEITHCPKCNTDLRGEDIYQYFLDSNTPKNPKKALEIASHYGWTKEKPVTFKREIGIEISDYYDGTVLYKCPDCKHVWKRFNWVTDEILEKYLTA